MKKRNIFYTLLGCLAFIVMTVQAVAAATTSYQYDDLHRLTKVTRSDGTVATYAYDEFGNRTSKVVTVAQLDAPVSLTVPVTDTDGKYSVSWGASATTGVTYTVEEATDAAFTSDLRTAYTGTGLTVSITGRSSGKTYYYRVQAGKSGVVSAWTIAANGCQVVMTCGTPASITVPASDADGNYTVSWGASVTPGITYELEEATNSTFTTDLRTVYTGDARSANITDASPGTKHYYRVRATKTDYTPSAWKKNTLGCTIPCAEPGGLTIPTSDADGKYSVSWGASITPGVTYILKEATDPAFTIGLRTAYTGTALSASITSRVSGNTYYYQVQAVKATGTNSAWKVGANGCLVITPCNAPVSITVPLSDVDGNYTVSWGASTTTGVTYVLEEATNAAFTTGLRTAYTGTALSAAITDRASGSSYYYRVQATKDKFMPSAWKTATKGCIVPAGTPASIAVPSNDTDGSYTVTWGASTTPGVTYTLKEATDPAFTVGLRTAYTGTALSANITGRTTGKTYYYEVQAVKDAGTASAWKVGDNGCQVVITLGAPSRITVPVSDADGSYNVTWGATTSTGATYTLEEATDPAFTNDLRTVYTGTATSAPITGRLADSTYFYRVMATKAGFTASGFRTDTTGCAVPGTATVATPAAITVPVYDLDGDYTVSWAASTTTEAGYVLQEATDAAFTTNLRTAYTGTELSASITGRTFNTTYYYRVKATKQGLKTSGLRTSPNGCKIGVSSVVNGQVAGGESHTVALQSDGTVVAVGDNSSGQTDIEGWSNIVQLAARGNYTVGLQLDGTVLLAGDSSNGKADVGMWFDIRQVAAGTNHIVGLRSDGTADALGDNSVGQCAVDAWTNMVQVAAGVANTVGLKADGTVVAVGDNSFGQMTNIETWTGIVHLAVGNSWIVGLKSDGTVVAAGDDSNGYLSDVQTWTDIVQLASGNNHIVGLKPNGTAVAAGDDQLGQSSVEGWTGLVQVNAGENHTVGLKSDGTAEAVGDNSAGQTAVWTWTNLMQVAIPNP